MSNIIKPPGLSRRQFVTGVGASLTLASMGVRANGDTSQTVLRGNQFNLDIGYQTVNFTGRERTATTVNGMLPAPVLRWKQGERVTLNVHNNLATDSSIHWHGMVLPTEMDGVPGLSFGGIKPGSNYRYEFDVQQHGTYWYHSHSGFQEQTGLYGAIIIDPVEPEPFSYDRDYVVLLSDWSDEDPHKVYSTLKKQSHFYNWKQRTLGDLWKDWRDKGVAKTAADRHMWNMMRMSDRDIADVNGTTYTYLMNGQTPDTNWTGRFNAGEKVRLRFINASAMSIFDIRIPGLKMTVVASDGQHVAPVSVDEFRIGTAETYDVIVEPDSDTAYCLFAQSIDRSGYARGTLTPDSSLSAPVPAMDPPVILSHADMGMSHSGAEHQGMNHDGMNHDGMNQKAMDHAAMGHEAMAQGIAPAGNGTSAAIVHAASEAGPQIDMLAANPMLRLDDPGVGLRNNGRRVLTYADLRNLYPTPDPRDPERELQLHLNGNMERYMWSINGIRYADAEPLQLRYGERLRITLVNDTMMNHPIHLHGMWSDLETGDAAHIPRKHTVLVQPGSHISYLVTADAKGRWAYHCHLMYHMMSMFREVRVS